MMIYRHATAILAVCFVAAPAAVADGTAPDDVAHWLNGWSAQPSREVSMSMSWRVQAEHEYLHCRLTNISERSMEIDSATLPWTPFNFVYFAAFNATGKAVYLEWRPVNMSVPPPVALVLGQGRSVEGDIDFSKLLFYEAASRDDLFLIWVTTVKLHRSSTQHATNYGFSEERVKGLTLVPKRRALKGE